MNYRKIKCDGFNLHIINNKKFHTLDLKIYFTENVNKEKITYRNALIDMMTLKTKKYDKKEKLIKKCQDLYSLYPVSSSNRYGNLLATVFSISIINSKYIDHNNVFENIELLKEIILDPMVNGNAFLDKDLNIVKDLLKNDTKAISEEPRLYSNVRLLELLSTTDNYALTGFSDLEVLNKMTGKSLYQSYQEMINESKIDLFISGNLQDEACLIERIKKIFAFPNNNHHLLDAKYCHKKESSEVKVFKETKKYQQSKLSMALKAYHLNDFENKYVLKIFNELIGGGANSLLMRNVREEHSLCYYIGSYVNSLDELMVINSGINKENYEQVLSLIKHNLTDIQEGHFKEIDLTRAKTEYLVNLESLLENNRRIIDYYYGIEVFKSDDITIKKQEFKRITREDIMQVAKKIQLDTIFFLEGDL